MKFYFMTMIGLFIMGCKTTGLEQQAIQHSEHKTEIVDVPINKLTHIVFLKLKEDLSDAEKLELTTAINKIKEIDVIERFSLGEKADTGDSRFISDHDLVFFIVVDNEEDYKIYQEHPLHLSLKEVAKKYLSEAPAVFDYWTL